jgi:putative membrane protein insertion efficiency factor
LEVKGNGNSEKHYSSFKQEEEAQKRVFGTHVLQKREKDHSKKAQEGQKGVGTQLKGFAIFLIKLWQRFISPLYPPSCRYYPTCSNYAIMAVEKYGVIKGTAKALWRILRCNPFSKGGVDYP